MKRGIVFGVFSLLWIAVASAGQAHPAQSRTRNIEDRLRELLAPVGIFVDASSVNPAGAKAHQFQLQWQQPTSARGASGSRQLSVVSHHEAGAWPRQRALDLTPGTLLVAALDASGKLRAWRTITDPRFLRSEAPGPDGVLTGTIVPNPSPEFRVSVPDDPGIIELRLYEPQQTADGKMSLALVDKVRLP